MNDFIDLPHLPECLLGLPLETIHEIHSHTYHAIKADRQQRGEPVPWENFPGYLIDHREGEIITEEGLQHALSSMLQNPQYSAPQPADPAQEPSVPDGWRLVPVEPTEGMRDVITSGIRHDHMVSVYQAMLEAAPKFGEEQ